METGNTVTCAASAASPPKAGKSRVAVGIGDGVLVAEGRGVIVSVMVRLGVNVCVGAGVSLKVGV